jgi:hypothetical protein
MACGIENPSKTGTACVTPSPESNTIPVVLPDEYLSSVYGTSTRRGDLQTEYSLNTSKESRNVERFKEDLSGYISILPRVQRSFRQ